MCTYKNDLASLYVPGEMIFKGWKDRMRRVYDHMMLARLRSDVIRGQIKGNTFTESLWYAGPVGYTLPIFIPRK